MRTLFPSLAPLAPLAPLALLFLAGSCGGLHERSAAITASSPSPTASPAVVSRLKYEEVEVGTGRRPLFGQTALVRYSCALENGKVVETNIDNGNPALPVRIGLGEVIMGWEIGIGGGQGIPPMQVGGKRKLIVPPELGYGSKARGSIPANSTLIFELELLSVQQ